MSEQLVASMTAMQTWFFREYDQLYDPLYAHTISAIRIDKRPDRSRLKRSVEQVLRRHDVLRGRVRFNTARQPVFELCEEIPVGIDELLISPWPALCASEAVSASMIAYGRIRFNISEGPLLRIGLLISASNNIILTAVFHHGISDGESLPVFWRDLLSFYNADCERLSALPPLPVQYFDFVDAQQKWLRTESAGAKMEYWLAQLKGAVEVSALPTDRKSPINCWSKPFRTGGRIDGSVVQAIRELSRAGRTSPFLVLLSAFAILLSLWSNQEDTVVWVVHAGRRNPALIDLIGCFLDMWPLRVIIRRQSTFEDVLRAVRAAYLRGFTSMDIPGYAIYENLPSSNSIRSSPMNYFNFFPITAPASIAAASHKSINAKFHSTSTIQILDYVDPVTLPDNGYLDPACGSSLNVNVYERHESVYWGIRHNPAMFEDSSIVDVSMMFSRILDQIAIDARLPITSCLTD